MALTSFAKPDNKYYKIMKEKLVNINEENGTFEIDLSFMKGY